MFGCLHMIDAKEEYQMKNKLIYSLFFYALTGLGISLTVKANIGVSSFNSFNMSLSVLSGVKVGTITSLVNGIFLIVYIILTKGKYKKEYLRQGISVYSLGLVINFFVYVAFKNIVLSNYLAQVMCFVIGVSISGFGTGMVLNLRTLAFPIESVCNILSKNTNYSFMVFRYSIDIVCIIGSLFITLFGHTDLYIREGTLISLFLLSFTISTTKSVYEKKVTSITSQYV